ncbi:hypothetical protein PILCRDRAFT_821760 [Piloderma croceum F 1598]|uniref:Fungal calcium binding protein domain-containing protein n=1 Tax=Piloderma croceum (strain F 1598) TaxID=765440 RepID=A0A0C3B4Z5_PILCF|nr:hypothetical protein PILCRDRAFT_821760 [Piloderma croceum F 1598]
MQFTVVALLTAFAASAYAIPTAHLARRCDVTGCAVSLGPTAVSCVTAAVQDGLDPLSDAGCLTSGASLGVNLPSSCSGCTGGVGTTITSALGSAESSIKSIF